MSKAKTNWQVRAVQATHGNQSQFGAILLATMEGDLRRGLRGRFGLREYPAFASCACVTSDGYITAGFIDKLGEGHSGAFVGDVKDYIRNVIGLADHLKLKGDDRKQYLAQMRGWISTDYRANRELF